jgi:hypothetical protein
LVEEAEEELVVMESLEAVRVALTRSLVGG